MSAWLLLPWARSRATAWAFVTPAGIRLPITPEKIRSVAWPSIFGPSTDSATLTAS